MPLPRPPASARSWPSRVRLPHTPASARSGGSIAAIAGVICLSYAVYGCAAFFMVVAALNFAGGYWYLNIARSASART